LHSCRCTIGERLLTVIIDEVKSLVYENCVLSELGFCVLAVRKGSEFRKIG